MGSPFIFSGNDAKNLKTNIDLAGNVKILSGTTDPSSSAVSAPIGSIYLNYSNGYIYKKLDYGSTTNWVQLATGGAVSPTVQKFTTGGSSGTYTTPANVVLIRVRAVGGGGGGGGSGTASGGTGGTGGDTTLGGTLLVAHGGSGGQFGGAGGAGGTVSTTAGPIGTFLTGAQGTYSNTTPGSGANGAIGSPGADSALGGGGGGGGGGTQVTNGIAGIPNTGGGGGGGGLAGGVANGFTGAGGGAGAFIDCLISGATLASSFAYQIGVGGAAGLNGTSGFSGGQGGTGYIEIIEYYSNGSVGTATNVTGVVAVANGGTGQTTARAAFSNISVGTNTNDNATAGNVGEYVESVTTPTVAFGNTTWGDATSISLTAGDWNVTGFCDFTSGTATGWTSTGMGISTTSGNSTTGLVYGSNRILIGPPPSGADTFGVIPVYRISLASTTTVYLKTMCSYSSGTPGSNGCRLSARRVR